MEIKTKSNISELTPIYNNQKSFYKKAYVNMVDYMQYNSKGLCDYITTLKIQLYSYNTLVCEIYHDIEKNKYFYALNEYSFYSNTTAKHVKEFLKQYLYYNEVKKILIEKNYTRKAIQKYNMV